MSAVTTMPLSPFWVIVRGDRLEGRGMGVRQGAAGSPEDLADAQVLERPRRDDQERIRVELRR